ncbi:peptidase M13 [Shewanella sp. NFH-SH190041]|uniref:M13 family metallopeptidase n=1 Tax=Shewanella sp. NFH-SH190041 TaxID=2950245 RepID=UPI0021C4B6BA|nr:M13-type metalloendopeptidase [Shewanella sp. NFH-SH190041]BDM65678.1 peptidase M13 [Shewanella sp. NFH-SH190041]
MKNTMMVLLGLCSAVALSGCNDSKTDTSNPQIAETTPVAQAVSAQLGSGVEFNHFDHTIRPQDDFYSYVNGAWLKENAIPADRTSIGAFYDLRERAKQDVKAIIETLADAKALPPGSDEQKVADLYRAFMDTDTLNKLGIQPLQPELERIAALKNKAELATYFGYSQIIGGGTPMAFYISVDAKNSSRYAPHIWQYGLSLPEKDYYFNEDKRFADIRAAYQAHISKMFALAGFAKPEQSAKTVLALETAIAQHHWDVVETRDSTKRYNLYPISELNTLAPDFNWAGYLKALGVEQAADIIINQPSYITGLAKLVQDTPLAQWQTYLRWQLLTQYAGLMGDELDQENFHFFAKTLNGQQQQQPRWKRGVSSVNATLGEVVGKVYVKQHFAPQAKTRMQQLVENLRKAYGESINELDWMSPDTKAKAQQKLAKFTPKIGYPDQWKDYDALTIKADELIGNKMRAAQLEHQRDLAKLNGPIQKWEWFMTPQTVNAYYNPTMNEIVFPAAILQPPFFNMAADDAVNYGGIGAVIGHEMGHGFDDQGAKYDGDGNLTNWWTEQDLKEFTQRGKALINQYAGYQVFEDLPINGELTLGENIGDLSGVTIAYRAYKMSLNGKEAPVIDGLSGDERFFIGFTQIWRAKIKEESMRNRVATDPHSPAKFRAIGSLSNMPEFYQTFDVKEGDAMYLPPEQRVKIW